MSTKKSISPKPAPDESPNTISKRDLYKMQMTIETQQLNLAGMCQQITELQVENRMLSADISAAKKRITELEEHDKEKP